MDTQTKVFLAGFGTMLGVVYVTATQAKLKEKNKRIEKLENVIRSKQGYCDIELYPSAKVPSGMKGWRSRARTRALPPRRPVCKTHNQSKTLESLFRIC